MYIYVLYIGHVIRWQYSSVKKLAADVCAILTVPRMIRNFANAVTLLLRYINIVTNA